MPISLSDDLLTAVMNAAAPIAPDRRGDFLRQVADALQGREPGPGTVHRAIVTAQRQFFDPPIKAGRGRGRNRPGKAAGESAGAGG